MGRGSSSFENIIIGPLELFPVVIGFGVITGLIPGIHGNKICCMYYDKISQMPHSHHFKCVWMYSDIYTFRTNLYERQLYNYE